MRAISSAPPTRNRSGLPSFRKFGVITLRSRSALIVESRSLACHEFQNPAEASSRDARTRGKIVPRSTALRFFTARGRVIRAASISGGTGGRGGCSSGGHRLSGGIGGGGGVAP